jgi:hypothetical protein
MARFLHDNRVNGRATIADKVSISLKGDIVLPWDRQVLGEWNHLFFWCLKQLKINITGQIMVSQ